MRKLLRVLGLIVAVLGALVVVAVAAVVILYNSRANKVYSVPAANVVIPTDAAAIARGKHLVEAVSDCVGCHGPDLSGMAVIDDPALGTIYSRNLTTGEGGVGAELTDAQLVQIIRHGVKPDGKSLMLMPVYDYQYFSDEDVAAVVAYLRTLPPVEHVVPAPVVRPLGMVLTVLDALPTFTAGRVDHSLAPTAPAAAVNVEYGHYLIQIASCAGCHTASYGGGPVPGSSPDAPRAANLTPSGELGQWTAEMFIATLRTGVKPSGIALTGAMPWQDYGRMTDDELTAIFLYLQTLPPAPVQ